MNLRNTTRLQLKCDRHNTSLPEQYKQEKKRVKTLIDECRTRHYRNELNNTKGNFSKTWKIIKEIVPNSKTTSNVLNFDNAVDKANEFNFYFTNVGKNTYSKTQEIIHGESESYTICENVISNVFSEDSCFGPQPVDTDTVVLTIKSLY